MLSHISGYRITETLHSSTKSIVYLAARDSDDVPVVIKTLNEAYPNHQQIARFLHEVDIHKKLDNIQGVASVYNVENHGHQQALVLEYISGGELAKQLNQTADYFIELFFKSAIQIADALSAIHQQGIIHKDIKPKNILWQPHLETIKIIDFGIASESVNEKQSQNSLFLTGSLPFLSPEQTGRMNRSVDYRSDFYSLGVTFYKLLSGELPFDVSENDPMAWVHCHIARTPKPLMIKEPAITPALSAIINKLMAKNAEDRYQSALGLKMTCNTVTANGTARVLSVRLSQGRWMLSTALTFRKNSMVVNRNSPCCLRRLPKW
ncbi:MAG: serine/threonine-protein kinase [Methylococcales bacterium]|nr:serine/threonine-protein kinase [Methylococcales bacterium]